MKSVFTCSRHRPGDADLLKGSVSGRLFGRDQGHCKAICAAPGSAAAAVHIDVHRGRDLIVNHTAHALQNGTAIS